MASLSTEERGLRINPSKQKIDRLLHGLQEAMQAAFRAAEAYKHAGTRGQVRETSLVDFLNKTLPDKFRAIDGEVVDAAGQTSGQIDVIIFDATANMPFPRFHADDPHILPAEALLATIEVKSRLTKDRVNEAVDGLKRITALQPFGGDWASAPRRGSGPSGHPRVFTSVFGYTTDIVDGPTWPASELKRFRESCAAKDVPCEYLNRVVVLDRGTLLPAEGSSLTAASEEDAVPLADWYFHLINFLNREAARRPSVDWTFYTPTANRRYKHHLPPDFSAPPPVKRSAAQMKEFLKGRINFTARSPDSALKDKPIKSKRVRKRIPRTARSNERRR